MRGVDIAGHRIERHDKERLPGVAIQMRRRNLDGPEITALIGSRHDQAQTRIRARKSDGDILPDIGRRSLENLWHTA